MRVEFDLRPLARIDRMSKWPRLGVALAILGAIAVETVYLAGETVRAVASDGPGRSLDWVNVAFLGATLAFVLTGGALLPRLLPGAQALSIDEAGLELRFPRGAPVRVGWDDPRGFRLTDLRTEPDASGDLLAGRFSRDRWRDRPTLLTTSAFDAVVEHATRHGLSGASGTGRWSAAPTTLWSKSADAPATTGSGGADR